MSVYHMYQNYIHFCGKIAEIEKYHVLYPVVMYINHTVCTVYVDQLYI